MDNADVSTNQLFKSWANKVIIFPRPSSTYKLTSSKQARRATLIVGPEIGLLGSLLQASLS